MTLSELRTKLKARLNRSDCTDALADEFIDEGIKRVHRELRIHEMEKTATLTTDAQSRLTIPADYLEMQGLWATDGTAQLTWKSRDDWLRDSETRTTNDDPIYTRRGGYWYVAPAQAEGESFTLDYLYEPFANFASGDAAAEALATDLYDVLLYASLSAAGNHFEDDREAKWDAQCSSRIQALNDQADEQTASEGVRTVQPGTSSDY
jgi:hypothetical protein